MSRKRLLSDELQQVLEDSTDTILLSADPLEQCVALQRVRDAVRTEPSLPCMVW